MTERLKVLSGKEVVKLFEKHGAVVKRTTGSHMRICWDNGNSSINITVPMHGELKRGTLKSITKDCEDCFGHEVMKLEFYHK